jgi:hypothetical protein
MHTLGSVEKSVFVLMSSVDSIWDGEVGAAPDATAGPLTAVIPGALVLSGANVLPNPPSLSK